MGVPLVPSGTRGAPLGHSLCLGLPNDVMPRRGRQNLAEAEQLG
jgi:hypothetical protein